MLPPVQVPPLSATLPVPVSTPPSRSSAGMVRFGVTVMVPDVIWIVPVPEIVEPAPTE